MLNILNKRIFKAAFAGIVFLFLAGCKTSKPLLSSSEKRLRLAFITCAVDATFFDPVKKGCADAARMLDVDCDFIGTTGVDVNAQVELVRKAIRNKYDGIALNIIDPNAFDAIVQESISAGVPVVAFNVDDHATPNARLSAVNQRLYDAGCKLGSHVADLIADGSTVLLTMHDPGVSALEDRARGIRDALRSKNVQFSQIITGNISSNGAEVIAKYLKENPTIHCILGTGQSDTEAAGLAIRKYFLGKGYWSAGFDLSPTTLELIQEGHIRCTMDQQPYVQGFYPVVQLTHYLRYGIQPSNMDAGASIIDKTQVEKVVALARKKYR